MDNVNTLNPIHTPCRNCVFAQYDGITQTGCKLGRIKKFNEVAEVVEATDNEKDFYIINGRKCNAFRDSLSKWAVVNKGRELEQIGTELRIKAAILVKVGPDIEKTIDSLINQQLQPVLVVFINNQHSLTPAQLNAKLWNLIENKLTWRIFKPTSIVSDDYAIDLVVAGIKSDYTTVLESGQELPFNFIANLDKIVNEDLNRPCMIRPNKNGIGYTFRTGISHMYGGNAEMASCLDECNTISLKSLADKIEFIAKEQNQESMIWEASQVCPSLA